MDVSPVCGMLIMGHGAPNERCLNPAVGMVEWSPGIHIPACAECCENRVTVGNWGARSVGGQ